MLSVLPRDNCLNSAAWELILPYVGRSTWQFSKFHFSPMVLYVTLTTMLWSKNQSPHFTAGETGAQSSNELAPRSHTWRVWQSRTGIWVSQPSPRSGLGPWPHGKKRAPSTPFLFCFFLESDQNIFSQPMRCRWGNLIEQQGKAWIMSCGGYFHNLSTVEFSRCLLAFNRNFWQREPGSNPTSSSCLLFDLECVN